MSSLTFGNLFTKLFLDHVIILFILLFSLSYVAFWLFSHLYIARACSDVILDTIYNLYFIYKNFIYEHGR